MNEESIEFIAVQVPRQYVTRVYELVSRLDQEERDAAGPDDAQPVADLSEELVARMYRESQGPHRRLMEYLADHAGEWQTTSEIADALDLEHGWVSLRGSLSAFSRRAGSHYDGLKPWESRDVEDGSQVEHRMNPEVAGWVKGAAA